MATNFGTKLTITWHP